MATRGDSMAEIRVGEANLSEREASSSATLAIRSSISAS